MTEKDLIRSLTANLHTDDTVMLGAGDDCAVLKFGNQELLFKTDAVVEGIHFDSNAAPDKVGHKALARALSDIAAMGGQPVAFTLSLVMPNFKPDWMTSFRKGLQKISREYKFPLIGGDLVKGPLQISVTVIGKPQKKSLLRSTANAGDILCLSDKLGHAYIGFREFKKSGVLNKITRSYLYPTPQINYGLAISNIASSAIDISDGILQDLSHLISSSGVGCNINLDKVPVVDKKLKKQCLEFGDDYQILYTVAPRRLKALKANLKSAGKECHTIGVMGGKKLNITNNIDFIRNWDHFN